jgi:hypothetical protein
MEAEEGKKVREEFEQVRMVGKGIRVCCLFLRVSLKFANATL